MDEFTLDLSGEGFSEEDLKQGDGEYKLMPKGWYTAALFEPLELRETPDGSIRIEGSFSEFENDKGETYLEGIGGIGGRKVRWGVWAKYDGEPKPEAVRKALTSLAVAFGVADVDANGKSLPPAADMLESLEILNGMLGSRCQVQVGHRSSGKRDDGTPFRNETIRQVKAI